MFEVRFIYKDGTCGVWSNIILFHIDTDGIYFIISNEPENMHFVYWNENLKDIKVVKK